jgi:L-aminopeptidase/D-esterase-like protein
VVLAPPGGMRAAAVTRGRATGTRELDALHPGHLVGRIDAILLTGGSAYGLGAADGVMAWLRARGRGFPVRPGEVVPIVPTAVLFDLGATGGESRWPGPADATHACDSAGSQIAEGSVGAGAGATVGKAAGIARAMKAGLGTWAQTAGGVTVGALVVVNAVGDVRDGTGAIVAGARDERGGFVDALAYLATGRAPFGVEPPRSNTTLAVVATDADLDRVELQGLAQAAGDALAYLATGRAPFGVEPPRSNTTLAVVATDADLDRVELQGLAQAAGDALARRITPYGTLFDGDVVFAVSIAKVPPASPLQVEALAAAVVPEAVERAVRLARGTPALPGLADRK